MAMGGYTVFGGSGFIGRYVVRALAQSGQPVRVAVRHPDSAAAASLKPMGDVGQVTPIAVDVRSDAGVQRALAGADAAVNLCGILFERGRQRFQAIHAEAPGRIARAARRAGVTRLVHVSAIGADPRSPCRYLRSKGEGEAGLRAGFPDAAILRPSIVFGPEDGFFNRFAELAVYLPALPLIGGGATRFQPVHVGDVAEAVARALTRPAARGRSFELGGPTVYSFKELMVLMLAEIGRRRALVPIPFAVAEALAFFLERLPMTPLLTRDQVRGLRVDSVVTPGADGLAELGIAPTACEVVLPTYLRRYRR